MSHRRTHTLRLLVRFSLFITSYIPLFFLIGLKQISEGYEYLNFGGITYDSIRLFIIHFGFSAFLCFVSIAGVAGLTIGLGKIRDKTKRGGTTIHIIDVKNKNSEAIGYIATYIIPFLFQDYSQFYDVISVIVLLSVICIIYINSALILINPLLNVRYALYEVEFTDTEKVDDSGKLRKKNGLILTQVKHLHEGDALQARSIGHKLYFALPNSAQHQ